MKKQVFSLFIPSVILVLAVFVANPVSANAQITSTSTTATSTASTTQSITILSPNGGEVYSVGQSVSVKWKTTGLSQNVDSLLYIADDRIPGWQTRSFFGSSPVLQYASLVSSNEMENIYEYKFTVPKNFNDSLPSQYHNIFGDSHYKMGVIAVVGGQAGTASQKTVSDFSDKNFSLVQASQTPVPAPIAKKCYQFNVNMAVGSEGSDVVALQTFLIANGYDIPSISSGTKSKGYFDSETQLAVGKYQNANGIPNTGFVGPLTRGALNSSCVNTGVSTASAQTVKCPDGYICTPIGTPVAVVCPVGYVCTPIVNSTPVPPVTSASGSITVLSPNRGTYDSSGQIKVQWTGFSADFDYYQLLLGNTIANAEVQIDDGQKISKYQNSYNTFALWDFVNQISKISGYSADAVKNVYYVKVNAIKTDVAGGRIVGTGKSAVFSISSSATVSQTPTPVISGTFNGTLSASLVSSNEDQAGMWGVFGPGAGYTNTDKTDWGWQATLKINDVGGKNIKSMTILSNNYGEGWSTSRDGTDLGKQLYPLVIASSDKQVNVEYVDSLPLGQTNYTAVTYKLYGQKESSTWPGGKLIIRFSDGSQAMAVIPASATSVNSSISSPTPIPVPVSTVCSAGNNCPHISSVTSPISSGQRMSIQGANLYSSSELGGVYIDNTLLSSALIAGSKGGAILFFTIPNLTSGTHSLYVTIGASRSNIVNFVFTAPSVSPSLTPTPTYSPTPSSSPTSSVGPIIKVNPSVISSGGSSKLSFTFPPSTTKAQLYFYCPSGVLTGASPEICNRYIDVTSNSDYTIMLYNFSAKPQYVVPNYYIYAPDNPSYGRGVSSQITVNPSSTSNTSPSYSPTPSPTASPSALIVDDGSLNASIWSAVDDYFKDRR